MVGYKRVPSVAKASCKGCVFDGKSGCSMKASFYESPPCDYDDYIFVEDKVVIIDPQVKLISALDISLVDGVLQELTDICNEQGSRIRPSPGESIRDFVKRLIYNQGKDE
jgi:hypothetical protein